MNNLIALAAVIGKFTSSWCCNPALYFPEYVGDNLDELLEPLD
jgi:hypothetical protein